MKTHVTSRAERLTTIEQMLFRSPAGLRVVEIAQACGVDRRTIYRDLALLGEIGIPVYQKDARFFINRDYYRATMRLSLNEAITLLTALRVMSYHQAQQNPHAVALLRKLADILPSLPAEHTLTMTQRIAWGHPVDRAYVAVYETVVRGWCERRLIKLWDGRGVYEFATYFLEPSPAGVVFAVGCDVLTDQMGIVNLSKVRRAALLKATYDLPAHANPYRYLANIAAELEDGLGQPGEEIRLIFTPAAAGLLRTDWHWAVPQLERLEDGRYLLRLSTSDWQAALPWVRSWGPQVEVIAPKALREHLARDAAQLASVYGQLGA